MRLALLKAALLTLVAVASFTCRAGAWVAQPEGNKDAPLCQELEHRLHSYRWTSRDAYWGVVVTDPKLQEPPWQDLAPEEHKALLQRLNLTMSSEGFVYQDSRVPLKGAGTPEEFYRIVIAPGVARGQRFQLWRARVNEVYDMGRRAAPPGPQTILQERTPIDAKALERDPRWRHKPLPTWQGSVFFAQSDLSGPDPSVDIATARVAIFTSLLLFDGVPYFFDRDGTVYHSDASRGFEWTTLECFQRWSDIA